MSALSPSEASDIMLSAVAPLTVESAPLGTAIDCALAEEIIAPIDMPPWRASSMDGFAVRAADISAAPRMQVAGNVAAGARWAGDLPRGSAVRIMTGAPVPDGADTVIRVEDTASGDDWVEILDARDARRNVRPMGEDYKRGEVLARAGDRITPALAGVLASAGAATVRVHRRPTVAIITSGDELVTVENFDLVQAGERIVSSTSYTLPALVRSAGGTPADFGIVPDDPSALAERLQAALVCDLVLTTGGVSVGERDYTRTVLAEAGAELKFWRVRMRPGGPLAFGIVEGRPWVGIPGNPVSSMVAFELFVRPMLLRMAGHRLIFPATLPAILDEPVTTNGELTNFMRVTLTHDGASFHASLTGSQSSGVLTSMARADALLIVPEGRTRFERGETLGAISLFGGVRADRFPA